VVIWELLFAIVSVMNVMCYAFQKRNLMNVMTLWTSQSKPY